MSTATIIQAQGLRQHIAAAFGKLRAFAIETVQAHGQPASVAVARRQVLAMAADVEHHSPALSAELRNLASK
jgi:hypothetical protein